MEDYRGKLIAVIGDEDTVTGFLLAGIGQRGARGSNFMVVDSKTPMPNIEAKFNELTERDDIGIVLINQHIANEIRHLVKQYNKLIPTVLEIPSKEHPYDPEKDEVMKRVNLMLGVE
mmetsp:Transcript_679/g.821  ORF Transcript_679/g.821 Transcript_679/m.821 type:complete len:117 (-) Transcript_679:940-1290(-)